MKLSLYILAFTLFSVSLYAGGGHSHHVLVRPDGTMWAWGANDFGQLGTGDNTPSTTPVEIGSGNVWTQVSRGQFHNVALDEFGRVWSWGENQKGQLGLGHNENKNIPTLIAGTIGYKQIAAGSYHSLAVTKIGALKSWGANNSSQLGDTTTTDRNSPIVVDTNYESISAGASHSLGLKVDGTLWSWGSNGFGQLGDGTNNNSVFPVQIGADTDWSDISAGLHHSLALKASGNAYSWGKNYSGQLGKGDTNNVNIVSPSGPGILKASSGSKHTLLLTSSFVGAMGANTFRQLGQGDDNLPILNPMPISFDNWADVDSGEYHNIIESGNGEVYSFGRNNRGQAGVGYISGDSPLTNIFGPMSRFKNEYSMEFDGTDDEALFDYVHQYQSNDSFSMCVWFKTDFTTSSVLMGTMNGSGGDWRGNRILLEASGNIAIILRNNTEDLIKISSVTAYNDDKWHLVSLCYDGSSTASGTHFYIDAIDIPRVTISDNLTGSMNSIGRFRIGTGVSSASFLGLLDETSVWNKELDQQEISDIYNAGTPNDLAIHSASSNLVGWWRMGDGDTYPIVKDHSGQGNDGTMTNMTGNAIVPTYPDFNKNAVSFDGVDDYIDLGPNYSFDTNEAFSFSTWLKSSSSTESRIMRSIGAAPMYKGYDFVFLATGDLLFTLQNDASTSSAAYVQSTTNYRDGNWHHLVASYSGNSSAGGMAIYIDGSSIALSVGSDSLSGSIVSSTNLFVSSTETNASFLNGLQDEISIWNKELTPSEVSAIYAGNTQIDLKKTSMSANLVGWWRMGDGDVTPTIKDHSVNANHGTMVNGPEISNIGKTYMLVDISSGPSGNNYPVSYTDTMPDLTGAGNLTYKGNIIVLKYIPAGMFTMGNTGVSDAEHQVTLTKGFYAGVFEVTQKQWLNVMGGFPSGTQSYTNSTNTLPLENVSWEDIRGVSGTYDWPTVTTIGPNTFMGNLMAKTGLSFDLPTEAEWEYACRAGTITEWSYGSVGDGAYEWDSSNASSATHEVGGKLPNPWGFYDIHGNVWEWCLDWHSATYSPAGDQTDPGGTTSGSGRVIRGGAFSDAASSSRSALRSNLAPTIRNNFFGLRLFFRPQ